MSVYLSLSKILRICKSYLDVCALEVGSLVRILVDKYPRSRTGMVLKITAENKMGNWSARAHASSALKRVRVPTSTRISYALIRTLANLITQSPAIVCRRG